MLGKGDSLVRGLGLPVLLLWVWPILAIAQELTDIQIEPNHADAGKPVTITLSFDARDQSTYSCGIQVALGDGTTKEIRLTENDNPLVVTHVYKNTGVFSVTAEGKTLWRGFQTSFACGGSAKSAPVSVHAEGAAVKAKADEKAAAAANAAAKRAAAERANAERKAAAEKRAVAEANASAKRAAAERAAAERKAADERSASTRLPPSSSRQTPPADPTTGPNSQSVPPASIKTAPAKAKSVADL